MSPQLLAVIAVPVYGAWWWVSRRLWPWHRCPGCRRHPGRSWGSTRGRWGKCRLCKGRGERQRWGARWVHPELKKEK